MRFALLSLVLAACAPLPPEPQQPRAATEDPNSGTMECHDETPTGSNISRKVCRPKQDVQDQRNSDTVVRQLETPRANPGLPPK
jgi:hypothetical protein